MQGGPGPLRRSEFPASWSRQGRVGGNTPVMRGLSQQDVGDPAPGTTPRLKNRTQPLAESSS